MSLDTTGQLFKVMDNVIEKRLKQDGVGGEGSQEGFVVEGFLQQCVESLHYGSETSFVIMCGGSGADKETGSRVGDGMGENPVFVGIGKDGHD